MTPTTALNLAEAVVADGFGAHRAELAALFAGARRAGVRETLVSIAADPTEVDVVRLRALGRVVVAYSAAVGHADEPDFSPAPAVAVLDEAPPRRALVACGSAA